MGAFNGTVGKAAPISLIISSICRLHSSREERGGKEGVYVYVRVVVYVKGSDEFKRAMTSNLLLRSPSFQAAQLS